MLYKSIHSDVSAEFLSLWCSCLIYVQRCPASGLCLSFSPLDATSILVLSTQMPIVPCMLLYYIQKSTNYLSVCTTIRSTTMTLRCSTEIPAIVPAWPRQAWWSSVIFVDRGIYSVRGAASRRVDTVAGCVLTRSTASLPILVPHSGGSGYPSA